MPWATGPCFARGAFFNDVCVSGNELPPVSQGMFFEVMPDKAAVSQFVARDYRYVAMAQSMKHVAS